MREILIGEYIKNRRLDLGLTQEQVCEGVCTAATLSRLENNKQTPSRSIINALLNRLGLPDDRFFALVSENESKIEALKKNIRANQIQFEKAANENRFQMREQALKKLAQLEKIIEDDDAITQQYILTTKIALGTPNGPYSFSKQLDMLTDAIQLTIPWFEISKLDHFRYNMAETQIVNQIARAYSKAGKRKEAIDIYSRLLRCIEKNDRELAGYAGQFCLVAHNYAINLALNNQYEKAIEIAERGRVIGVKNGDYLFLPGFLAIQAECYYFMGEPEKSAKRYFQACYLYEVTDDEHNFAIIQRELYEHLGLRLPY